MYEQVLKQMCRISDSPDVNTANFLEACNYIDNLYHVLTVLRKSFTVKDLEFQPSFKGKDTSTFLGIESHIEENELRFFIIKSEQLGDVKLKKQLIEDLNRMNENINIFIDEDVVTIINR